MAKIETNKVTKNIFLSISVQIISLIVGFVLGLIVPKFIDEYQYSYWQMYALYVSYVGVMHFGLLDGLMLRYSQYDYHELNKEKVGSQFKLLVLISLIITMIGVLLSELFINGEFKYVVVLASIGVLTKNVFTFASYVFQMTNRINNYAKIVIIQKASYGVLVLVLLLFKVNDFRIYCLADLIGDVIAFALSVFYNKALYFAKNVSFKFAISEYGKNISVGVILMLANLSSMFLLGSAKMVIQWKWDVLTFGKVSFAFSLSSLFLTFISAISIVLFPSIRRMKEENLPSLYVKVRNSISPILFGIMLMYFPLYWILEIYLPNYKESLVYLGLLLPMIIYSARVNLLTNNYLKAYRKEKTLFFVNLISIAVTLLLLIVGAFVISDLVTVLFFIVIAIMFNSVLSEIIVLKIIKRVIILDFFIEVLLSVIFVICVYFFELWIAFVCYALTLLFYFVYKRKEIKPILIKIFSIFRRH